MTTFVFNVNMGKHQTFPYLFIVFSSTNEARTITF